MRTFLLLSLAFAWAMAETMSINTPYRGKLYDEAKPFMLELFKRNGYMLEYQQLPPKRGLINANSGVDDGDGPRVKEVGKKFLNLRRVDVPILEITIHAHYKDKDMKITQWDDLKPYHVAVRTGTVIQVNNVKKVNPQETTYVPTNEKLFELLEQEKVDVVIAERVMARGMKKKLDLMHIYQSPVLLRKKMYLFFNKKHSDKIKTFEQTLLKMNEEGYQKRFKHFYETGESTW